MAVERRGRKHLMAVNRTIRSGGLDEKGIDSVTIEVARDLARKVDAVGLENAPTRLHNAYLSAAGRLHRAAVRVAEERARASRSVPTEARADGEVPKLERVEQDPLTSFVAKRVNSA